MKASRRKRPDPKATAKAAIGQSYQKKTIKAENKSELRNYYLSKSGRSLGLNKSNLSGVDKLYRAMDIVGNTNKMIRDFDKSSDKVTSAFKAVRRKK